MDSQKKSDGGIRDVKTFRAPETFSTLNRLIVRDLNNIRETPRFYLYNRDDIQKYLSNPYIYEKQLRQAVIYMYTASSHFRRLIQYFTRLTDFSYVISPHKIDPRRVAASTVNRNYRKVINALSSMNIKTQFAKVLTVCLREDVFYGTFLTTDDNITIQQLPSDYCSITTIEGNVFNVTFDFSYFDTRHDILDTYPEEFKVKYNLYQKNRSTMKWIELDCPKSFAIKCNTDILTHAVPPFVGILREVYDLEDYKGLKMTRTALENYAMLDMRLPLDDEGEWGIDYDKAVEFWRNLDDVLPPEIGTVLSPMPINKISFERSKTGDIDNVSEAEKNLFTSAGVSSLLFNNDRASGSALALSIKVDQGITYGIVKSIEDVINRFIQSYDYGRNFKVTFLDCSEFNRKELGDQYLKAAQFGLPTIMMYAASQGLGQEEFDSMNFLENDVLKLKEVLIPLLSSTQMSSSDISDVGGRPKTDDTELTPAGETSREYE